MSDIKVNINGKEISGQKGDTILDLARREGFEIPTLCHDPRLEPFSSCYLCVVEIEGMRGLQPSCSTRIVDGMKVQTENGKIKKARKTALELLLSAHYADCIGPCKQTCPAGVDVQGYISLIEKGLYTEAVGLIKEVNPLPAICGRVCVRPCEVACRRNLLGEGAGVGVDYLKRFAADYDLISENRYKPEIKPDTGKKVAVIGSGPGGLSTAYFLRKEGHSVDIFEASPAAGGMLRYGIPEYRLPNDLLQSEIETILGLGVNIHYRQKLGENLKYRDLRKKYDALVLTIGSQKGTKVGCEGDDAHNVLSGIDFLRNMEMTGQRPDFSGKKVAVVGGGNTAMDCCRSAVRCGAEKVYVIYRRTEAEMPANPIEIHESKLEGVEYLFLTNPVKINKDEKGSMRTVTCIKMQLGEPDASGRKRPEPVPGSEFELELDYVLAAIGQKTDTGFIADINDHSPDERLQVNRWGNIDANPQTLQTGVRSIFAAGDGVTGPATIIEAIAQARKAAASCHQFLMGLPIEPAPKEFLSKKEHFKTQTPEDYTCRFEIQNRQEMPTLAPADRRNFKEVELGYVNEEIAKEETKRCLECGCNAYFSCDLKKYSTEYQAEQEKFKGDFREYKVDFSHPFIEIDNNKCILCARCVRICSEVVGANALGLVNRGFDAYVAPSLGESLTHTDCESCGLCISTCPTGAIAENFPFKPGPVQTESIAAICNYCSVGCEISLRHKSGFFMEVRGSAGRVNADGNICRFPKFGYHYLNMKNLRITKPLLKINGKFQEISFDQAFSIIAERIKASSPDENAFFAGARLTNEEQYLIQKLARGAAKTNNIHSFHYLGRARGYRENSIPGLSFEKIADLEKIYLLGAEINKDNGVVGFMIQNAVHRRQIPLKLITHKSDSSMRHKAAEVAKTDSYYHFLRAANLYILKNKLYNPDIKAADFKYYQSETLKSTTYLQEVKLAGANQLQLEKFAQDIVNTKKAAVVYSEKYISSAACLELQNLMALAGKDGDPNGGLIGLKEKNNAKGLFEMGVNPAVGPGGRRLEGGALGGLLKKLWGIQHLPATVNNDLPRLLQAGAFKNLFIFGEDPVGCAIDREAVEAWIRSAQFVAVQDYFMTPTAKAADLILPASYPIESGGTFVNTQGLYQTFEGTLASPAGLLSFEQLTGILHKFGLSGAASLEEARREIDQIGQLPPETMKPAFNVTQCDSGPRLFNYGCDAVHKEFEEYFEGQF